MRSRAKKKKPVILVGHSLGARLIHHTIVTGDHNLVDAAYTVGGAISCEANWRQFVYNTPSFFNFYSTHDSVLKLLYRVAENDSSPIGLQRISNRNSAKRHEFNLSTTISGHSEYAPNADKWLNKH